MRISGISYSYRKTRVARRMIGFLAILVILVFVSIAIISAYVGWSLTHPKRQEIPVFSANIVPEHSEVLFSDINKKIKLNGWFFKTKGSDKAIILAHGYGANLLQFDKETLDMVKGFMEKGYNILLFDFRNSGKSEGNVTTVGFYEKDDLLGAIQYTKNQQGMKHIVLLGYSMGAATSIAAAAESNDVDAVIADSPFMNLNDYLNNNLSVWSGLPSFPFNKTILFAAKIIANLDPDKVSPAKSLEKVAPRPVMFIHSKDDKSIPVENSKLMYEAYSKLVGSKAVFWETKDADHIGSYGLYKKEYMDRIFQFLDSVYPKE
ncbi:MAG: alpha/beta hydrolase [Clostridia bacterium]|nr:alpha/beta hydrolase [Clostridia bacterium]